MNKEQLIILWVGIAVFVMLGLIAYNANNVNIDSLCLHWAMVSVVTGSIVYTLGVRPDLMYKILQQVIRFRKAIIVCAGCLFVFWSFSVIEIASKEKQMEKQRKKDASARSLQDSMRQILNDTSKWCELNEAEKIVDANRWMQLPSRLFSNRPPDETYSYIGGIWLNKERVLEMKEETVQSMKQNLGIMIACVREYPDLYESHFEPIYEKEREYYAVAEMILELPNEESYENIENADSVISLQQKTNT